MVFDGERQGLHVPTRLQLHSVYQTVIFLQC